MIRKRKAAEDIEGQLAALEAQLRGEGHGEETESPVPSFEHAGAERRVQEMAAD